MPRLERTSSSIVSSSDPQVTCFATSWFEAPSCTTFFSFRPVQMVVTQLSALSNRVCGCAHLQHQTCLLRLGLGLVAMERALVRLLSLVVSTLVHSRFEPSEHLQVASLRQDGRYDVLDAFMQWPSVLTLSIRDAMVRGVRAGV